MHRGLGRYVMAISFALFAAGGILPRGAASQESATPPAHRLEAAPATVERLYAALEQVASRGNDLGLEGRRLLLAPAVEATLDLEFMAARVLGRHWRALESSEKKSWQELFTRLTVASYAERFDSAEGLRFEVLDAKAGARGTALVHSRIHPPDGEPVAVDYRLRPTRQGWRIIDVYLNGTVSELALRRSEYASVIDREGFEKLSQSLDAKIRSGEAAAHFPSS